MTLLHIIDTLCDVTTKQADLLRELVTDLEQTVELVRKSHTTFLGPKYADSQYKDGYDKVLLNMGYRLWISEAAWKIACA